MATSFTPATSLIFAAAQRTATEAPIDFQTQDTAQRNASLKEELAWLSSDPKTTADLLREVFPAGVPLGLEFYRGLEKFRGQLGFTKWAERIVTCVWIAALQSLNQQDAQGLLMSFAQTGHVFFEMHRGLPALVDGIPLPASFVTEWFPALVTRLGDDGDTSGVWGVIDRYCERAPSAVLNAVEVLALSPESETHMRIVAEIIGVLRSLSLETLQRDQLSALAQRLAASSSQAQRHCYLQSWTATAYRGALDVQDLDALLARCASGTGEDVAEGISVVCRLSRAPALSEACFLRALGWLQQQASADLPSRPKHAIAVTLESVADRCWSLPEQPETDLGNLLLRILPIAPASLGTWRALEDFLMKQMHHDRGAFERMLQAVGERSAGSLYPLIRAEKVLARLISEMVVHRNDEFVARLILQSGTGGRELGLGIFERLGLDAFPSAILDAVNERDLRTALFVFQALGLHGDVIARFLWAVAPRFQRCGQEAQSEFSDELLIQCKNYPRACLEALKRPENPPGLVRTAVEKADTYFAAREKVRTSPLNTMQVPAYRRMAERKWRTMNREIHDQAHEQSIFAEMIRNVEMLYGDRFSSYGEAGLSDTTPMREHSFEFEFPHLEFIAAEDMALRRWHALQMIGSLIHTTEGQ